ncbi:hypothetical protein B0H11DRAFT_1971192 [Mycena galericulata]|nr:hypothetical protein B0H11DRAFT_1971192 [Mycena galericulata]
MSESEFTTTAKNEISTKFRGQCALCICHAPTHLACRILDEALDVELRLIAIRYNLVSSGYDTQKAYNGLLMCPTCHLAYMAPGKGPLALIPCPEICEYLFNIFAQPNIGNLTIDEAYLRNNPAKDLKAYAFLDHFVLHPSHAWQSESHPRYIATAHFPSLSYFNSSSNSISSLLPPNHPADQCYRIFDASGISLKSELQSVAVISMESGNALSPGAFIATVFVSILMRSDSSTKFEQLVFHMFVKGSLAIQQTISLRLLAAARGARQADVSEEPNADEKHSSAPSSSLQIGKDPVRMTHKPTADCEQPVYSLAEENEWAFGPSWSATDIITKMTGVMHPEPWRQSGDPRVNASTRYDVPLVYPRRIEHHQVEGVDD